MPLESLPAIYWVDFGSSFGHPAAGFFFVRDFFTASFQLPSILRRSGLGPRLTGVEAVLGMRGNR